jgi:hypothetical protein
MAALQVSHSAIQRWLTLGCPYRVVGHRRQFDLEVVRNWRANNITPKPGPELSEGRLREQNLKIQERQFRLAKMKQQYVLKAKAEAYLTASGRQIRSTIMGIADRIAGKLAAEQDQDTCHAIMTAEIRKTLTALADTLVKWDGGNYDPHARQ